MKKYKDWSFNAKFALWFWGVIVGGILLVWLVIGLIANGKVGYLPPLEELQNPKNRYASELFSADGESLGRYYRKENRVGVSYQELSPDLVHALVATEDARFYRHTGVDMKSLFRAVLRLGRAGGGSTLTQQLAKQLWSPRADNIFERAMQKPIEWVIATKLERLYSKDEILTMYLNQFDFLHNAVGIKSASQVYFSTTPAELKIEEAATLVGMCKNPAIYNPVRRPERTQNRRNTVLNQMCKYNYITSAECDSLKQIPLTLKYRSVDHKQGLAPYFREYLRQVLTAKEPKESQYPAWNKAQYALDKQQWEQNPLYGFCNKNHKPDGTPYDLYQDGLRIYTTIDARMQRYAEEAVHEHMTFKQEQFFAEKKGRSYAPFSRDLTKEQCEAILVRSMKQTDRYRGLKQQGLSEQEIRKVFDTPVEMQLFSYDGLIDTVLSPMDSIRWEKYFLRCGFMSIDPHNGHVKTYVGGPHFHFQFDMATLGKRQIGSTVKPFLYTLAMDEGMWPCEEVLNEPYTLLDNLGREWTPKDSHSERVGEMVDLTWGLKKSSNWLAAYLMSLFTPDQLAKLMHSFGIRGEIDAQVSMCLGTCDVSVEEMTDAYTAFVNRGIRTEPLYVTRIEDNNGNVLATFSPQTHEIISELTSYKMIYMLEKVITEGTAMRLRGSQYALRMPMGGKTGTTQNNSDGWFIGFTPELVAGCWVGGEDRAIHFDSMERGQGARTAMPIFALFMQKIYNDPELGFNPELGFDIPEWFDPNAGCK